MIAATVVSAGFLFGFSAGLGAIGAIVVFAWVKDAETAALDRLAKWWRR